MTPSVIVDELILISVCMQDQQKQIVHVVTRYVSPILVLSTLRKDVHEYLGYL